MQQETSWQGSFAHARLSKGGFHVCTNSTCNRGLLLGKPTLPVSAVSESSFVSGIRVPNVPGNLTCSRLYCMKQVKLLGTFCILMPA